MPDRSRVFILRLLCVGCTLLWAGAIPDRTARADGSQLQDPLPLDAAADALGLTPLRKAPPATAGRELRIWVDYDYPTGSYLLLLHNAGGAVDGELIAWTRNGAGIRTRELAQPKDWKGVLRALDSHAAWTLPSEPITTGPDAVAPCGPQAEPIALLVETRGKTGYRSYQYNEVDRARPDDLSNVKAIIDMVHGLAKQAPAQNGSLPRSGCG